MNAGGLFVAILFLAVLTQWLAERFFGNWLKGIWMIYISAAIGVALCCGIGIGGLGMAGIEANVWVDRVLTGLIIGGGSNAVHDFFGKWKKE
jgi:hypothetical protein